MHTLYYPRQHYCRLLRSSVDIVSNRDIYVCRNSRCQLDKHTGERRYAGYKGNQRNNTSFNLWNKSHCLFLFHFLSLPFILGLASLF